MDARLYKKLVSRIPLFQPLAPEELDRIVKISKLVRVRPGISVIKEGSQGTAMYMLVEGSVRVEKAIPGAGEGTRLADIRAPSVFGEMALIDGSPRSASVISNADSVLLIVELSAFQKLRHSYNPAAFKILRELAATLCRRMDEKMKVIEGILESPRRAPVRIDEIARGDG